MQRPASTMQISNSMFNKKASRGPSPSHNLGHDASGGQPGVPRASGYLTPSSSLGSIGANQCQLPSTPDDDGGSFAGPGSPSTPMQRCLGCDDQEMSTDCPKPGSSTAVSTPIAAAGASLEPSNHRFSTPDHVFLEKTRSTADPCVFRSSHVAGFSAHDSLARKLQDVHIDLFTTPDRPILMSTPRAPKAPSRLVFSAGVAFKSAGTGKEGGREQQAFDQYKTQDHDVRIETEGCDEEMPQVMHEHDTQDDVFAGTQAAPALSVATAPQQPCSLFGHDSFIPYMSLDEQPYEPTTSHPTTTPSAPSTPTNRPIHPASPSAPAPKPAWTAINKESEASNPFNYSPCPSKSKRSRQHHHHRRKPSIVWETLTTPIQHWETAATRKALSAMRRQEREDESAARARAGMKRKYRAGEVQDGHFERVEAERERKRARYLARIEEMCDVK